MRYSATAFFLFCCYAFLPATAMEKYENPALNRVKFETPLNHRPLELVAGGHGDDLVVHFVVVGVRLEVDPP